MPRRSPSTHPLATLSTRLVTLLALALPTSSITACSSGQPQAETPSSQATDSNATDSDAAASTRDSSTNDSTSEPSGTSPTPSDGGEPCKANSFEFEAVREACERGGVKAAKKLMKDVVERAKDSGNSLKCSSCHDNTKTYSLAENAVSDLRALLGS